MKRLICVELLEEHQAVNFYGIRFSDESETLFDQFLDKYSGDKYAEDFDTITVWLDRIGERGALERHFRPEGHPRMGAVPADIGDLRLYCFRISDNILLFGGGGLKKVAAFQDDPELHSQVKITKKVGIKLLRYIERNQITAYGKQLFGKLTFEIEV